MSFFGGPTFGSTTAQNFGSPKPFSIYQPMPAVGVPSFGGRPNTPKEHGRHSSYPAKDVEPPIQPLVPSLERPRRSREYYLEGGDLFVLVENYLFRVHKFFFERESPVFKRQFADIAVSGQHRLGASDSDPLVLHDVKEEDFTRFLWVFYNPKYSIYDAPAEDWAAILGLAHYWQFAEVKELVVRELEKQTIASIYKIVIYHRYDVDRGLLLPSYTDLVSRERTLSFDEAKDLGLETSLMIMTARELVRKGDAPTSVPKASAEELRNIIRQVFRFPGLRPDSPLSDITAAEPTQEYRSPPLVAERNGLSTVPENEGEKITFTTSASLNSKPPVSQTPIISAPTPPAPAPPTPKEQESFKPAPVTPKKNETKPATVSPKKEEQKPKEEPAKATLPPKQDDPKPKDGPPKTQGGPGPNTQDPLQSAAKDQSKQETQDDKKKSLASRLADAGKGAGSPTSAKDTTTSKDKDGDKVTDNKEAKDAKDATDKKDATGAPATGQDSTGTPVGTPLLKEGTDQPGTPTPGQSVSAKKAKALLAQAGKIKKAREVQEAETSSNDKGKGKETIQESPPAPSQTNSGSQTRETTPGTKGAETETGVKSKGKVAGDKEKGKSVKPTGVESSKGSAKVESPGDEKRREVGQDPKKPGDGAPGNATPAVATDNTTKPATDDTNTIAGSETPNTMMDKKDRPVGKEVEKEKTGPTPDGKATNPKDELGPSKQKVEPVMKDEGDVATPKRVTKELPTTPVKPTKEKLGLAVPEPSKNSSSPSSTAAAAGSTLSPLQQVLEDAEKETLMERMARLKIGGGNHQQPKEGTQPAHTDLESEFECETAPSGPGTPTSRAERSFNLVLRSDVPMSDDDDFFLECDSNASVSNFEGW